MITRKPTFSIKGISAYEDKELQKKNKQREEFAKQFGQNIKDGLKKVDDQRLAEEAAAAEAARSSGVAAASNLATPDAPEEELEGETKRKQATGRRKGKGGLVVRRSAGSGINI